MKLAAAFLAALGVVTFVGACAWLWGAWAVFTAAMALVAGARGLIEVGNRQRKAAKP